MEGVSKHSWWQTAIWNPLHRDLFASNKLGHSTSNSTSLHHSQVEDKTCRFRVSFSASWYRMQNVHWIASWRRNETWTRQNTCIEAFEEPLWEETSRACMVHTSSYQIDRNRIQTICLWQLPLLQRHNNIHHLYRQWCICIICITTWWQYNSGFKRPEENRMWYRRPGWIEWLFGCEYKTKARDYTPNATTPDWSNHQGHWYFVTSSWQTHNHH